jgi:GNAT superfamily N-acetyltransferase
VGEIILPRVRHVVQPHCPPVGGRRDLVSIQLRDANGGDASVIATLLSELGHPASAAEIPKRMDVVVGEGGAVLLAVDESGAVLGLMSLARHVVIHAPGPVAYITALVTASAARRRGVGQMFVEAAKAWARERGCVRLTVTSAEHRADAHAFYPACGMPYNGRRFSTAIVGV